MAVYEAGRAMWKQRTEKAEAQVAALAAELADYRATLQRVLREREAEAEKTDGWYVALGAARRQVATVRALHFVTASASGGTNCGACSHDWPCPTLRALDGAGPRSKSEAPSVGISTPRSNPGGGHEFVPVRGYAWCGHVVGRGGEARGHRDLLCDLPHEDPVHQTPAAQEDRLALAERVCVLFGRLAIDRSVNGDGGKAATQAWMDWHHTHGQDAPTVTADQVSDLAATRDRIRAATLARLRSGRDPEAPAAGVNAGFSSCSPAMDGHEGPSSPGPAVPSTGSGTPAPYSIGSDVWPGTGKVIEEAGELLQVLGKLIGAGGLIAHWDDTDLTQRLIDELADLRAAAAFFEDVNLGEHAAALDERREEKYARWQNAQEARRGRD